MKELPKRKPNRLVNYDYSLNGAYFVTICTKNRMDLFGKIIVGAASCRPQFSEVGEIVESEILKLKHTYQDISVDYYVIMPNHVHMIISIHDENGRQNAAPTVSRTMNQWKRAVSIKAGFSPWQKSFHDHIIRNEQEYINIAEYIENNPINWKNDCFYGGVNS
jgi:REP element-mobilizing transposase RayT